MDGELWISRGQFERLTSTVTKQVPDEQEWLKVNYMIFDLPAELTPFDGRLNKLKKLIRQFNIKHLQAIAQFKVASSEKLTRLLSKVTACEFVLKL